MLYCEIHCPGHGTDVEAVYRELGGGGGVGVGGYKCYKQLLNLLYQEKCLIWIFNNKEQEW